MNSESEFYVGYLPTTRGLKKSIRRIAAALAAMTATVGVILVAGQNPFTPATFEFQQYGEFRGMLLTEPYPAVAIPGQGLPWLLVGLGKHGPGDLRPWNGREVQLRGERILRGEDHMIQLQPGTLRMTGAGESSGEQIELVRMTMTGEIVDSKCFFGVMNPGSGKVHRDCAARCISGGIPPALLVSDATGRKMTILLAHWRPELLDHVAEPVTLRGRLTRSSGQLTLYLE